MQETTPPNTNSTLIIQSRDELAKVELSKTVYFESNSNYTKVYYVNGHTLTVLANLSSIEKQLESLQSPIAKKFLRVGRFIVINTDFLSQINIMHQQLTLTDGVSPKIFTLKASKESLRSFKEFFAENAIGGDIGEVGNG